MSKFEYDYCFMGWRRHNWALGLTRFESNDGRKLGTWQLWVGPFVVCRIFKQE